MDYIPAAEVRVIDGDTIRLDRERIRILGIDTPEMGTGARCNAERRLAEVAKMALIDFIEGERLEIDRRSAERFGRTRAYIRVSGADVGELPTTAIAL